MEVTYPIAERFHSIQGEGEYAGFPMHFVRLAGCNVGKPQAAQSPGLLPLYPKHTICTNVFGESFLCDTDYAKTESITVTEILADTHERHMCITGGEPLLYDLQPIIDCAADAEVDVHIETSGTKPISQALFERGNVWITCSPKEGFIVDHIVNGMLDELKFTVSATATVGGVIEKVEAILQAAKGSTYPLPTIWLQPINGVHELYRDSALKAMEVLEQRPTWRLCVQVHKAIGVR